ncbi:Uncharacterised protein [Mycobacteroides abscessus subsp. abscessus]|nr:Uncharacterised protein [Mycobacteroides abscessus subsp. abscessus]
MPANSGGTPSSSNATVGGTRPSPHSSTPNSNTPSVGSARSAFTALTTRKMPRPVCPMNKPSGTAITTAASTASAVYSRCSPIRIPKPLLPVQWAAVKI